MKLKECFETALACRLDTVGEALANICNHAISLFANDEVHKELDEMYDEFEASGLSKETLISEALKTIRVKEAKEEISNSPTKISNSPTIMRIQDGIHVAYFVQTIFEPKKVFQYNILDKVTSVKVGTINVEFDTGIALFTPLLENRQFSGPQMRSLAAMTKTLGWEKK